MAQYSFDRLQGEYAKLWQEMEVIKVQSADAQAKRIIAHKDRYQEVEKLTGVPWFAVGVLHMRESDGDFHTWLHNGDRMTDRNGQPRQTVNVPAGRPPNPNCSWELGAYDALIVCEHFDRIPNWNPERVAYAAETFNGWGYRSPSRNIPSPYLWGGTNIQKPGKFVRDGVYDPNVMDSQIGAMAVLKEVMKLDPSAKFSPVKSIPPKPKPDVVPQSPRADDTESQVKPLPKSTTIWGGIISALSGLGGTISAFFDKLNNPYTLAAFVVIVVLICLGAYLVISGRIQVQGILQHLSRDDSDND